MNLSPILKRFVDKAPLPVMMRAVLERELAQALRQGPRPQDRAQARHQARSQPAQTPHLPGQAACWRTLKSLQESLVVRWQFCVDRMFQLIQVGNCDGLARLE